MSRTCKKNAFLEVSERIKGFHGFSQKKLLELKVPEDKLLSDEVVKKESVFDRLKDSHFMIY